MMSVNNYLPILHKHLLQYARLVSESNSLNLSNETVLAEDIFRNFFNTVFGYKLVNANEDVPNRDTIDLIDRKRKLAIQVTANKNFRTKYNKTLATYCRSNNSDGIEHLIILFFAPGCPKELLRVKKIKGGRFEAFDIVKLLNKVKATLSTERKWRQAILIFQQALAPVQLKEELTERTAEKINRVPTQLPRQRYPGLFIDRGSLISEVFDFSQQGNGLLVGGPGAGKSVVTEELQRFCQQQGIACFIIRINELLTGDDAEIGRELQAGNDWINVLKKLPGKKNTEWKSVLLFDAFDTAKDQTIRTNILHKIRSATSQLAPQWSVLVSARTFDAMRSSQLLELFPIADAKGHVSCRAMTIPDLTDGEIVKATKRNAKLHAIYTHSSAQLKELLKVPYFLKLLETLVSDPAFSVTELKGIETEEQLLEMFWAARIETDTRTDIFLRRFTALLVSEESLSCAKNKILDQDNYFTADTLRSLHIITDSSITGQNFAFSHNILLEFAIHKYLLPEKGADMRQYLLDHPKTPFFFRQSFIYFYSKLWRMDRPLFWKHYLLMRKEQTPLFRLFCQTILNFILATYHGDDSDFDAVFALRDGQEKNDTIRKILEAIRFVTKNAARDKDAILFLNISKQMAEPFLWELGFLLHQSIGKANTAGNKKQLRILFEATVNYTRFVLQARKKQNNPWLVDHNGGMWMARNLSAVFHVNRKTAIPLFTAILDVLSEVKFPIQWFSILADELIQIAEKDTGLASAIYRRIYYHNENSKEETQLGNGVVMALRSNRAQDFNGVHYRLEANFAKLIIISPEAFIPLGLEIASYFTIEKKTYHKAYTTRSFKLFSFTTKFTPEPFLYDDEDDKRHGPLSHVSKVVKRITQLIEDGKIPDAKHELMTAFKHANAGVVWRRLIELVAKYPRQFKGIAEELLMRMEIFAVYETVYDIGVLVKAVWPFLAKGVAKKIERKILALPVEGDRFKDPVYIQNRVLRLLSCIDESKLQEQQSIGLLAEHGKQSNPKEVQTIGVSKYTPDRQDNLRRMGIDSTDSAAMQRYEMAEKLEAFNNAFNGNSNAPSKTEYQPLLSLAKELLELNRTDQHPNERIQFSCDYELSRFASILARKGAKVPKALQQTIEAITSYYLQHPEYAGIEYDKGDIKSRFGAYAPNPRTSAVDTLINLLYSVKQTAIEKEILSLAGDNMQPIRMKIMRILTHFWHTDPPAFWKTIRERAVVEQDGITLHQLLVNLTYDDIIEADLAQVEFLAKLILGRLSDVNEEAAHEIWRTYTVLLIKMMLFHQSTEAEQIFRFNFGIKELSRNLVFQIIELTDPHIEKNDYASEPDMHEQLFRLQYDLLLSRCQHIQVNGLQSPTTADALEVISSAVEQWYYTVVLGKSDHHGQEIPRERLYAYFTIIRPAIAMLVEESGKIGAGFMVASTGYHLVQLLHPMISYDAGFALGIAAKVVSFAAANNFTYDSSTLGEVLKFTETILVDHKDLLSDPVHFDELITMLDLFASSGWQEALELTWRLKEYF